MIQFKILLFHSEIFYTDIELGFEFFYWAGDSRRGGGGGVCEAFPAYMNFFIIVHAVVDSEKKLYKKSFLPGIKKGTGEKSNCIIVRFVFIRPSKHILESST